MKEIKYFSLKDIGPTTKTYSIVWASYEYRYKYDEVAQTIRKGVRIIVSSNNKHALGITLC